MCDVAVDNLILNLTPLKSLNLVLKNYQVSEALQRHEKYWLSFNLTCYSCDTVPVNLVFANIIQLPSSPMCRL